MSGVSEFVKAYFKFVLERVPVPILEKVEDLVQRQLGKGSGAWSTKNESRAVADFAKSLLIKKVVAIDAGANIGNWTSELLEYLPDAEVIAFEQDQIGTVCALERAWHRPNVFANRKSGRWKFNFSFSRGG